MNLEGRDDRRRQMGVQMLKSIVGEAENWEMFTKKHLKKNMPNLLMPWSSL